MGATTQCMLDEMDNDWESTWSMLTQLESTSGGAYLEELMEGKKQHERLMELQQKEQTALTADDKRFLVENFNDIEMAYHYQDVSTKDD